MMNFIPYVIEETGRGDRGSDIISRLLKERIIMLQGGVDDDLAALIMAQLLYLDSMDQEKDIFLYINSPGGSVTAGFQIYDTMQFVRPDVVTVVGGFAASMGAFLLAGGTKGKRYALPNSVIMIHQPLGGFRGQASDVQIHAEFLLRIKRRLTQILAENTGRPYEELERDTDRDNFMSAEEAVQYGLIDRVISRHGE
jgi:ATP-dependent Clp protease, protease subunit